MLWLLDHLADFAIDALSVFSARRSEAREPSTLRRCLALGWVGAVVGLASIPLAKGAFSRDLTTWLVAVIVVPPVAGWAALVVAKQWERPAPARAFWYLTSFMLAALAVRMLYETTAR